jgi:hypothetical protein
VKVTPQRILLTERFAEPAQVFGAVVARHARDPVLRYSTRLNLLRLAQKLGIGRFDANLIIAVAQHRAEKCAPLTPVKSSWWITPLAIAITQGAIIFSAWLIVS